MLEINDKIEITIESMANGGDAVGRHNGQAIFIPYGVPGDRVRAVVTQAHKTYAKAAIAEIVEASLQRARPPCPYFGECGSCQWQMMGYQHQLLHKKDVLTEVLRKISGLELPDALVVPAPSPWNYRNKAQYPIAGSAKGIVSGYYKKGSHSVVPVERCLLVMEPINRAYDQVRSVITRSGLTAYDEKTGKGKLRHILIRCNGSGDDVSLTMVMAGGGIPAKVVDDLMSHDRISSVWINLNNKRGNVILGETWELLAGRDRMKEVIGGIRYELSAGSFWQINQETARLVYQLIIQGLGLKGDEVALDLYCGIGAITLQLAGHCRKVLGVEVFPQAVKDAARNASINGFDHVSFLAGPAGETMDKVSKADVLVADPPRSGLEKGVVRNLKRLKPTKIAYLSCDPATMARDISLVAPLGYRVSNLWLADMFPQTYHIEALAILERT